jgi:hypothetical protein
MTRRNRPDQADRRLEWGDEGSSPGGSSVWERGQTYWPFARQGFQPTDSMTHWRKRRPGEGHLSLEERILSTKTPGRRPPGTPTSMVP